MKASEDLSVRLKSMLLETALAPLKTSSLHSSSNRPLIEILHEEGYDSESGGSRCNKAGNDLISGNSLFVGEGTNNSEVAESESSDEDEGPPPIAFHGDGKVDSTPTKGNLPLSSMNQHKTQTATHPVTGPTSSIKKSQVDSTINNEASSASPSLAEEMIADATRAKEAQSVQKQKEQRKRAQNATFGFKQGFLNSSTSSKSKGEKSKAKKSENQSSKSSSGDNVTCKGQRNNDLIYELDGAGNMSPLQEIDGSSEPEPSVPSSSASHSNSSSTSTSSSDPLLIPEVQERLANELKQSSSEWATTDFIESISKSHPKLAAGLSNPKYTAALQSMQTHPKETMERLKKDHPDVLEFLQEFCGVIGDHFEKLGEMRGQNERTNKEGKAHSWVDDTNAKSRTVREMGPLEEKALRSLKKKQEKSANDSKQMNSTSQIANETKKDSAKDDGKVDDQVSSILSNDELRSILLDPKMQHVMDECTQNEGGRKLHYYLRHEEYGPKVRKLMEVGLLRIQ